MKRDPASRVTLTRELKLRLLESLRAGIIDMAHFPELQEAQTYVTLDMSVLTEEERAFLLEIAIKVL